MSTGPDRFKSTTIGHVDHVFLGPLSDETADRLISALPLPMGGRVVDIGCGKAGFLIRMLTRRPDLIGVGVDINPAFLAQAAIAGRQAGVAQRLTLIDQPAEMALGALAPLEGLFCMGATQALGGLDSTLRLAREALGPTGLLLIGEGYWRAEPDPEYLDVLGATADELLDHSGNAARIEQAGFRLLASATASEQEWDAYEDLYFQSKSNWALANPDDLDASDILARARQWRQAYLSHGRLTLGFGWYVAARVQAPAATTSTVRWESERKPASRSR